MNKTILTAIAAAVIGVHSAQAALIGNPAGAWLFDGDLTDSSGNGNDGSVALGDPSYTTPDNVPFPAAYPPVNTALWLDGNDAVTVAPDASISTRTGSFTVQAWVKRLVANKSALSKRTAGQADNWELVIGSDANNMRWILGADGGNIELAHNAVGNFGTWHHYVLVADRSSDQAHFYYDGILVDTESIAGAGDLDGAGDGHPLIIGGTSNLGSGIIQTIDGRLDEIAIFQRALSGPEVLGLYNNSIIPEPGTLAMLCLGFGVLFTARKRIR